MAPWEVSYAAGEEERAIDAVYLVGPWADDVVQSEIATVMDCAIVGLTAADTSNTDTKIDTPKQISKTPLQRTFCAKQDVLTHTIILP